MGRIRAHNLFARLAGIALLCAAGAACVAVPLRVPTKTKNVSGQETRGKTDVSFIQAGTTRQEEVREKLSWIDTGVKDERFFVGRWADSSWGVAWAAGGGYSGGAGWNRAWKTHNLVLDFDEQGVVRGMSFFPDKDIVKTLSGRVARDSGRYLDLSTPIEVPAEYVGRTQTFLGRLVFSKDTLTFLQDRQAKHSAMYDFRIPAENLSQVSMGRWVESNARHPENVVVRIHLQRRTSVGSKIDMLVDLPTTMTLIRYVAQMPSGS
jgi:hypothetical protein